MLDEPEIRHYLDKWSRAGDYAVVAMEGGERVGAAWYRLMPQGDPGYGFVAPDVPEIGIAVAEGARGRGIGGALLRHLIAQAKADGFRALSLSVQAENPAVRLYARLGWRKVDDAGDAWTMVRPL